MMLFDVQAPPTKKEKISYSLGFSFPHPELRARGGRRNLSSVIEQRCPTFAVTTLRAKAIRINPL